MRQISSTDSTVRCSTLTGSPAAPSSTSTHLGVLIARSRSVFIPQSAIRNPQSLLRFIVDQRVTPLGEAGPGLHLDDVIQHRPSDPERDLPRGALERTSSPGTSRGARIAREQLQL